MAKFTLIQYGYYLSAAAVSLAGAVRQAGHDFSICLSSNPKKIIAHLEKEQPSLIGFTCTTGVHNVALKMAKTVKAHFSQPIIFGGCHTTLMPETIENQEVDIICRGEGEKPLVELLDAIESESDYTRIPNLWVKSQNRIIKNHLRPLVNPLDKLPLYDFSIYDNYSKITIGAFSIVSIGRGCPYNCSFCSEPAFKRISKGLGKPYVRAFTVDRVLTEIDSLFSNFPNTFVVLLSAEDLGQDIEYFSELISNYDQNFKTPFTLTMHFNAVNEQTADILGKSNCSFVGLGIDAGSPRVRSEVINKNLSNKQILHAARLLRDRNIRFATTQLIGLPEETFDEMWSVVELNQKIKTDFPFINFYTPLPGTTLYQKCLADNSLTEDFDTNEIPPHLFRKPVVKTKYYNEQMNLKDLFQILVYFPKLSLFIKRRVGYRGGLLTRLVGYVSNTVMLYKSFNPSFSSIAFYTYEYIKYLFFFRKNRNPENQSEKTNRNQSSS